FVANRAHHADIGGMAPGSLPLSTEIFHEGIIIPPVKLVSANRIKPDVMALVCANSRTPNERKGDLAAQTSANHTGIQRFQQLVRDHSLSVVRQRVEEARDYSEAVVRNTLLEAPEGEYRYTDCLDDDGAGNSDLQITVAARIRSGAIEFDFTG